MLENINLAFKGVWSHKMRSFLTMLGHTVEYGTRSRLVYAAKA